MSGELDAITGNQIVQANVCGECGGVLLLPIVDGDYQVRCLQDAEHKTLRPKKLTRTIRGVEYDIMTQQPATAAGSRKERERSDVRL